MEMDKRTALRTKVLWARILVRREGISKPRVVNKHYGRVKIISLLSIFSLILTMEREFVKKVIQ